MRQNVRCSKCNEQIHEVTSYETHPCCEDCYALFHKKENVTFHCETCDKEFEIHQPSSVAVGRVKWCSWGCFCNRQTKKSSDCNLLERFDTSISVDNPSQRLYVNQHEYERMLMLNSDCTIKNWSRSTRVFTYFDSKGVSQTYTPDFAIQYHDGSVVLEDIHGYCDQDSTLKFRSVTAELQQENVSFRVLNDRCHLPIERAESLYVNEYGLWKRPSFQHIFMSMASEMRNRSTCVRKQVGAVFVDQEFTRVLCFGYNGGISGDGNQCESLLPGACGCTHAEINAMTKSNESLKNSVLFVTTAPCKACASVLINRGVSVVYYLNTYRSDAGIQLLNSKNIDVISWKDFVFDSLQDQYNFLKSKT